MKRSTIKRRYTIFPALALALFFCLGGFQQAWAISSGITQYSGNPNTNSGDTCTFCHSGGVAPVVTLTGPDSIEAGTINTYTLSMSGGQENLGGFNVSASAGSLSAIGTGADVANGELKHTHAFNVGSTSQEWTFNFEAPVTAGTVTIYAAALSANGDGGPTGDNSAAVSMAITVTPAKSKLAPHADIGGPFFSVPGDNLQLNASNSTDGDGTIVRYLWDFGDGTAIEQGETQTHSYGIEGEYTVTMAATDNDGLTGVVATTVTVSADVGSVQGAALYNEKCFGCHGQDGAGGSAGAINIGVTGDDILAAIINIEAMQSIVLSAEEAQMIAAYLAVGGGEPPDRPTDGPGLYGMFCSACHGSGGHGGNDIAVTGAPFAMIDAAITNIPQMQGIDLSMEEIRKIADFLLAGGSGALPTDSKGLYDVFCSVCHGAGGHGGKYLAVTGASAPMVTQALEGIEWMQTLPLDQTQILNVTQYLAAGGEPPLPADGQGLYDTFCGVCHGQGGHGGKFLAVTGASNEMIDEAMVNEPWMEALVLTPTQIQLVADYLGAGGQPPLPTSDAGLYNTFCAVCHGAGGHGGKFFAVTGASDNMINEAINNLDWMDSLQLSLSQIQQISYYLGAGGEPPLPEDGAGLYGTFCAVCHGDGGHGGKFFAVTGAPAQMISGAIVSEPWMNALDLTQIQINQIASFLVAGGSSPVPGDGAGLYSVYCSVCHGADGRGGTYKVVTGSSSSFINRALNNVSWMQPLNLNSTQVQAITGFLAAGGGGSKPTDGAGLYHVYCETCHGPNGRGGPEENVSGASSSAINSAINGESAMRHLQSYLTSNDIGLISSFLRGQ